MKVLLDTNVILDIWLCRELFYRDSAKVLGRVETGELEGVLCPTTITTLHYLGKKILGEDKVREQVKTLLRICTVGQLSEEIFTYALESEVNDFEDAVIEGMAVSAKAECIVTRNIRDFKNSRITAKEPSELAVPQL